jgi:hypothetical protein
VPSPWYLSHPASSLVASAVYSTLFLSTAGLTSGTVSYTVPSGRLAILRDVDVVSLSAGAAFCIVFGPAGQRLWIATPVAATPAGWFGWRGRQIYGAGSTIQIEGGGVSWDVMASGYLLLDS